MKYLKLLLISLFIISCGTTDTDTSSFWANVRIYEVIPENYDIETSSLKTEIHENERNIEPGSTIWVSFGEAFDEFGSVRLPAYNNVIGVKLQPSTRDTVYIFKGWKDANTIEFKRSLSR